MRSGVFILYSLIILYLLFFPIFLRVFAIKVQELTLANSVILTPQQQICIPHAYTYLRARFKYGKLVSDIEGKRRSLESQLGRYGSPEEASIYVQKRVCEDTSKALEPSDTDPETGEYLDKYYCPLTTVVKITDADTGKLRHDLLHETINMGTLLADIISNFDRLPLQFVSPDPSVDMTEVEKQAVWTDLNQGSNDYYTNTSINGVFYPVMDPRVISRTDFTKRVIIKGATKVKLPVYPASKDDFNAMLSKLINSAQVANTELEKINTASGELLDGYFPEELFPLQLWFQAWRSRTAKENEALSDKEKEEDSKLISMITRLPLTTVKRDPACLGLDLGTMTDQCNLDIIVFIPVMKKSYQLRELALIPHPVPEFPDQKDSKWIQVLIKPDLKLYRDEMEPQEAPDYYSMFSPLDCFPRIPNENCRLCTSTKALSPTTDQCVMKIIAQEITSPPCILEDPYVKNTMQVIARTLTPEDGEEQVAKDVIITNDDTTTIIETCKGQSPETTAAVVPRSARVTINDGCTFTMLNAPPVKEIAPNFQYGTQEIPKTPPLIDTVKDISNIIQQNLPELKEHFNEHGYIYIITTISAVGILIWVIILYCVCKMSIKTYRKWRLAHPRKSSAYQASVTRLPTISEAVPVPLAISYPTLQFPTVPMARPSLNV